MRGVAGDSQHGGTVVHQTEAVLLHHGEGVSLAFAHDEGGAVGRGCAGGYDDVDMVLVAAGRGVVNEHLVQIAAGGRPQPAQNTQNRFFAV